MKKKCIFGKPVQVTINECVIRHNLKRQIAPIQIFVDADVSVKMMKFLNVYLEMVDSCFLCLLFGRFVLVKKGFRLIVITVNESVRAQWCRWGGFHFRLQNTGKKKIMSKTCGRIIKYA